MKKILSIVLIIVFAVSIPFIFNKSTTVEEPHKLDIDGNFILNEWVPSRVGEGPDWNYNLKPVKISERVWCYFGAMEMPTKENAGNMSNSCYIKGDDQWITWDTGPSYVFAKQAYAEMKKIKDMPVKTVIISHEHDDHWLGNNYYKEVHGAKIIGAASINENYYGPRHVEGKDYPGMQTRMIKALYQNATRDTVLALTDESFEETVEFEISGVKMEYVKVGYAHSEEDWYLYLPDDKVVLAADVVMNGRVTSNRDGLVIGQINAINSIKAKEWDHLVPGHGFIVDKSAADESVKYFAILTDRVLEKMEDGIIADFITKEVTLDEFRDKDLYYILSPSNVFRSYEELEMYDEDDLIDYVALEAEKKAKKLEEAEAKAKAEEVKKAEETKAEEVKKAEETKVEEVKKAEETKVEEVKKAEETKVEEVKKAEETKVEAVKEAVETKVEAVKEVVETKVEAVKEAVETKVEAVEEVVETKVEAVKEAVETKVEAVKEAVQSKVESVKLKEVKLPEVPTVPSVPGV